MIVNVTEGQKHVIESQGYMVIEFKKWLYDFTNRVHAVINDISIALIAFLKEVSTIVIPAIDMLSEKLYELNDYCRQYLSELDFYEKPKEKYQFVRSLGTRYKVIFSNKVIYHRCRDRC